MSKRLSAIFGLAKEKDRDKDASTPGHSRQSSAASPVSSPVNHGRLHKQRLVSASDLSLDTDVPPLEPPPTFRESASGISSRASSRPGSRPGSRPASRESSRSRPQTPTLLTVPGTLTPTTPGTPTGITSGKLAKKRSLVPSHKQEKNDFSNAESQQKAWIAGLKEHIPYDLLPLLNGYQLPELWDENGDVLVHLYPESAGRGPSFRVHSSLFVDSRSLNYLTGGPIDASMQDLHLDRPDSRDPSLHTGQYHHSRDVSITVIPPSIQPKTLYLPLELELDYSSETTLPTGDDLELVILYRNFFAFLGGGALISTPRQVSLFSVFMGIASILRRLDYSNADGSTWGDVPDSSFARYCEELRLADVRSSREKTIEAIVLGENMKHWRLYNEGFVHAAGRLDDIKSIKSPKFARISPITMNRLERASLDVEQRLHMLNSRLSDFEFPSIFAGIANSQTSTEAKLIRFKAWRLAFVDMRKFVLAQYRRRYGAWPPKASSKKNNFDLNGLNRVLVKEMEEDFNNLYDVLVNPREMTTRTADLRPMTEEAPGMNETIQHALRSMESEFDRSTPPVIPPIPFDTPLIPSVERGFKGGNTLAASKGYTKFKANELNELLLGSYNRQYVNPTPFVQEFMAYERRLAAGATLDQIIDNRCGQWLFIYVILQSLPMTAVDARDLSFTDGCEYFLFSAPRGGKPWMREDTLTSRAWYNVKSAGTTVSLSSDILDHQPEGIYRRSHCWLIAEQWLADAGLVPQPQQPAENVSPQSYQQPYQNYSPIQSAHPQHFSPTHSPMIRPMTPIESPRASPLPKSSSFTNLHVNLEQVAAPTKAPRPVSQYNPSITFESILGANEVPAGKSDKKKKK